MTWSEADLELLCSQVDDCIRSQKEENVALVNQLVILTETVREIDDNNRTLKRRLHSDAGQTIKKNLQKSKIEPPSSKFIKKEKNPSPISPKPPPPEACVPVSQPMPVTLTAGTHRLDNVSNSCTLLRPPIISSNNNSTNRIQIQHLKPGQQIRLSNPKISQSSGSVSTIRFTNSTTISSVSSTIKQVRPSISSPIILSPRSSSMSDSSPVTPGNVRTTLTPHVSTGSVITLAARTPGQSSNPTVVHIQKSTNAQCVSSSHTAIPSIESESPMVPCPVNERRQVDSNTASKNKDVTTPTNQASSKQIMSNAFKNFAKSIGASIAAEYGNEIDQAKMASELMQRWKKLTDEERRKYI